MCIRDRDYAERFHTKPYASLEEMIEKEQPDVLHVCTPHYLHVPMTQYALDVYKRQVSDEAKPTAVRLFKGIKGFPDAGTGKPVWNIVTGRAAI